MRTVEDHVVTVIVLGVFACFMLAFARSCYTPRCRAKLQVTKANLEDLHNAVAEFHHDVGRYPTETEGLTALIEQPEGVEGWRVGGYLAAAEMLMDAWGREFIYAFKPKEGVAFDIVSYGADGEPGGEGVDADLHSRDIK